MKPDLTRRAFLRHAALTVPAVAAFSGLASASEPAPAALPPASRPRKVIVVGAGLAGLAAAYELARAGHEVTVLEAQNRAGGRVWTVREPFADGLFVEAGAVNFGDAYRHLVRYVKELGLTVASPGPPPQPLIPVTFLAGRRIELKPGALSSLPFDLTAEEKSLGVPALFDKFLGSAGAELGDPSDPAWRIDRFADLDRMTLAQFLQRRGASEGAIRLLAANTGFGYGWSEISALHRLISDMALFQAGGLSARFLEGGSDRLPNAFAKILRERIWYGAPVVAIRQEPDRIRAVVRQRGVEQTLEADDLVCAVPVPALKTIRITPELPPAKLQILSSLEYAPVTRIYLQTRRRIWAEQGHAGTSATDLPIQFVSEQPFIRSADQTRGILECHVKGPEAERIGALDPADQISLAVEHLSKLHPGLENVVETGISVSWHKDPWAGGGYAWWKPEQLTRWMPELARAEGRIHFAGEHTGVLARTMEAALESGYRAAREIHEKATVGA